MPGGNVTFVGDVGDDQFISFAQQAALAAQAAQEAAEAAQAAEQAALASTTAALAAQELDDHADVNSASATNGQLLQFQAPNWINATLNFDGLGNVNVPSPSTGDQLQFDGTNWVSVAPTAITGFLPTTGGTLTGALTLSGAEADPLDAATRQFVLENVPVGVIYDIAVFFDGIPGDLEDILRFVAVRQFTLFANLTNSRAIARVAPTAAYNIGIMRNGLQVGSIDFAPGSTSGSFTFGIDIVFEQDDTLELIGAATADATIEDLQITLIGNP